MSISLDNDGGMICWSDISVAVDVSIETDGETLCQVFGVVIDGILRGLVLCVAIVRGWVLGVSIDGII